MIGPRKNESRRPFSGRRNVVALGFVSMLNDIASEMAYPVIPLFLTRVLGAPIAAVGVIEGIAEATANILKLLSGWLSDRVRNRKWFVAGGYLLSAAAKVGLALSLRWADVLLSRFTDRFGKGIRTSARDALLAESSEPGSRGAAFGLHRALDTAGAVIGPIVALMLLHLIGERYSLIFLVAAVPALLGVVLLLSAVREPVREGHPALSGPKFPLREWGRQFRVFLLASAVFGVGNSSDAFLILRAQSLGASATGCVLLYLVFNMTYSLLSYPLGRFSDRFGRRSVLITSFLVFAVVYGGFGAAADQGILWVLFPLYGVFMAMNEGVGKAHVVDCVPPSGKGTALGVFSAATGLTSFAASTLAGILWTTAGPSTPFLLGAGCAAVAGGILAWSE